MKERKLEGSDIGEEGKEEAIEMEEIWKGEQDKKIRKEGNGRSK